MHLLRHFLSHELKQLSVYSLMNTVKNLSRAIKGSSAQYSAEILKMF